MARPVHEWKTEALTPGQLSGADAPSPASPQGSPDASAHKQTVIPHGNFGTVPRQHVQMLSSNIPVICVSLAEVSNSIFGRTSCVCQFAGLCPWRSGPEPGGTLQDWKFH